MYKVQIYVPWKYYAKWKKLVTKDHILYDFTYTKRPEQTKL